MLLTMTLSEHETTRWVEDTRLQQDLKMLAEKSARGRNRRFWQIQGDDARLLAVGECDRP